MVSAREKDYVIQFSNIQKLEEIAKGSFEGVYKGLMQGYIDVAIKELYNQSISSDAKKYMNQEIAMSQRKHHPNIVSLYGYCTAPLCLVMEYLQYNLFDLLHNEQELLWDLRYKLSLDIMLGLEYNHGKSIIHRDLKNNNILLEDKFKAKTTNFGISRIRSKFKSLTIQQKVGNLRWMAPELMSMKSKYSKQSAIFALGVIFWEIAAREVPFKEAEDHFIEKSIQQGGEMRYLKNFLKNIVKSSRVVGYKTLLKEWIYN